MPRLVFPNGEDRLVYQTNPAVGSTLLNVNGTKLNIYLDEACTALANIANADGSANSTSQVTVDNQSQIPLFQGPVDGTDVLYLRPAGVVGNGYRVHARYDDQLDNVEGRLDVVETTTVRKAGGDVITASDPGVIPLAVRGAVGQTANLLEMRDDTGAVLTQLQPSGDFATQKQIKGRILYLGPTLEPASWYGGMQQITAASSNVKGLVVRGAANQTANLAEWQDSAGAVMQSVGADGRTTGRGLLLFNHDATFRPLLVRGAASQTANLSEFQNSAGTLLSGTSADGRLFFAQAGFFTPSATTGGATALPAAPETYLSFYDNAGNLRKIPCYRA